MAFYRALSLSLFVGGALLLIPAPAFAFQTTADPKKAQAEREKKAQETYAMAQKFESEGKLADAQAKYREVKYRYQGTQLYWEHVITIHNKLNELGSKLAVTALAKSAMYKRPHMDSWLGYEFAPPDKWRGIPPAQGWFGDQDSSEVNYQGQTIRVTRYTADFFEQLYLQVFKTYAAKDLAELQDKVLKIHEERYKGLKEESSGPLAGARTPCSRRVYSSKRGDRLVMYFYYAEKKAFALVGTWRAGSEDGEFIQITTMGPEGKTSVSTTEKPVEAADFGAALKVFDSCAKSFWIYDGSTKSAKAAQLDKGSRCSDWNVMASPKGSYIVEYATSPEFAKRVGEELEQIVALYKQVIPTGKGIPRCRVKVFDSEEDFNYYGQVWGAAAYWSPGQEEIVCYRFAGNKVKLDSREEMTVGLDRNPEEVTFKILYHEGFHQYMYYLMGRDRMVDVPSWLNEGLGDYFFGGQWTQSPRKFVIGPNSWRLKKIYEAAQKGELIPIERILQYDQSQYYSDASLCYAQGWAMNYFFLTSEVGRKKGYGALPQKMLAELKLSGDWQKATKKVWTGVDFKKMDEEFKEFVLSLSIPEEAKPENP